MLENFVDLKPGDVIVQNGANSAVGKVEDKLRQNCVCVHVCVPFPAPKTLTLSHSHPPPIPHPDFNLCLIFLTANHSACTSERCQDSKYHKTKVTGD